MSDVEYEILTEANAGETIGADWQVSYGNGAWTQTGVPGTKLGTTHFSNGLLYRRPKRKTEPKIDTPDLPTQGTGVEIEKLRVSDAIAIHEVACIVHDNAVMHGWWNEERNDGELIALIHSEVSEALEALRKPGQSEHCPELLAIEEELADIVIRVMDFSSARGWDLGEAIRQKHAYNITRPHKHGKKF